MSHISHMYINRVMHCVWMSHMRISHATHSVWFGATVRGDNELIHVGENRSLFTLFTLFAYTCLFPHTHVSFHICMSLSHVHVSCNIYVPLSTCAYIFLHVYRCLFPSLQVSFQLYVSLFLCISFHIYVHISFHI